MKFLKSKPNSKSVLLKALMLFLFTAVLVSCKQTEQFADNKNVLQQQYSAITEQEVVDAQKAWGYGIVNIGKVYLENGDYKAAATSHINKFYNYDEGSVLFKPTLASKIQFRTDFEGALSYFVAGNEKYPEDHGFAIKPWSSVRWEQAGIKITAGTALAMGNYYFKPAKGGDEVKVEYSFVYIKNKNGELKILLHDSHLPYTPAEHH